MKCSVGEEKKILLGKVTSVHGLRGWVKIYSWTRPIANIANYPEWWLSFPDKPAVKVRVKEARHQGKILTVCFDGCVDRDQALTYVNADIFVQDSQLPSLENDEYYWHQLEGLVVFAKGKEQAVNIGRVHHLMDTGANDVLVIRPTEDSIDNRERLVPWVLNNVVQCINFDEGTLQVAWDPDF